MARNAKFSIVFSNAISNFRHSFFEHHEDSSIWPIGKHNCDLVICVSIEERPKGQRVKSETIPTASEKYR